jgi:hypothetical protein
MIPLDGNNIRPHYRHNVRHGSILSQMLSRLSLTQDFRKTRKMLSGLGAGQGKIIWDFGFQSTGTSVFDPKSKIGLARVK